MESALKDIRSVFPALNFATIAVSLAPGIFATLCTVGIEALGGWASLEQMGYNLLFQLRDHWAIIPSEGWDDRIAVIAIDEASLKQYGQFPWNRDRYVDLLNELAFVQPAVIGFDILFTEPTPSDTALAEAIAFSGNYVVLGNAADANGQSINLSPILTEQAQSMFSRGHVHNYVDTDGITRFTQLCEGDFPSLGIAIVDGYAAVLANTITATGTPSQPLRSPSSNSCAPSHPDFSRYSSPTWINWPGPVNGGQTRFRGSPLAVYSFADVVNGHINADQLQNKIVLVGVDAIALDPARSPLNINPPITGMYVHAAIIDNLLNNRFLQRPPGWIAIAIILSLSLGSSLIFQNQTLKQRILSVIALPLAWLGIGIFCFSGHWWIPLSAPIATLLFTLAGTQWREQLEKQQIMNLFAMHVAPETAQMIWSRRGELMDNGQLPTQELTATVLFMDIRGFTTISEKMPSPTLVAWLNQYFAVMTDCIMEQGGVVDKYIGDAIMAVFGIPFPHTQPEDIQQDAIAAIAASITMHQRLQDLNQTFLAQGLPTINIGIGIHTGMLTAGSVGSRKRVNYSVFGDTVNTASRLESMTKTLPADAPYKVLMSEHTFSRVYKQYSGKAFGRISLKGRTSDTMTYTLVDTTEG